MKTNARAVVIATTAALMLTLLARLRFAVTDYQSWPGRMLMRGFYSLAGTSAEHLGLGGLIALHHALNFVAWFAIAFLLARLWYAVRAPRNTNVVYLVLMTIAVALFSVAASFVVYAFRVPDPRHGHFYAMLIALAFLIAALIPALAAFVVWIVRLRPRGYNPPR